MAKACLPASWRHPVVSPRHAHDLAGGEIAVAGTAQRSKRIGGGSLALRFAFTAQMFFQRKLYERRFGEVLRIA